MIKVRKRKILLLPGDGIGPEVIGEVKKIIQWFNDKKYLTNYLKLAKKVNPIFFTKKYFLEYFDE